MTVLSKKLIFSLLMTGVSFYSFSKEKSLLVGEWKLERAEGLSKISDRKDTVFLAGIDTAFLANEENADFAELWIEYFERLRLVWFDFTKDTSKSTWSFTANQDSKYIIYDTKGKAPVKRLLSYWTQSCDIISFTGFYGFYQPPVRFKIETLTSKELVLTHLESPTFKLFLKKISNHPSTDITTNDVPYDCINSSITVMNIKVMKYNEHPFLVDHDKKLVTTTADGHFISAQKMYTDPGEGCPSYLFDDENHFLLIECNGSWYHISKKTGIISPAGWRWMDNPSETYIGTYYRGVGKYYDLVRDSIPNTDVIYQFKDPND